MTQGLEFEGRDLQEALAAAAAATGVSEADLHYDILEQGRRGVFGLGAKSVRIRVVPALADTEEPVAGIRSSTQAPPVVTRRVTTDPPQAESTCTREITATLQRMFELMGLDLQAEAVSGDDCTEVRLRGADRRLLAQKDGELLSAIQFLLNRMARRSWPQAGRIQLLAEGQRGGRDGDLVNLIREVAQQVARSGRTKRLHPMNAYERRLVHITVREFKNLGSRSEGDGHLKRVSIFRQNEN